MWNLGRSLGNTRRRAINLTELLSAELGSDLPGMSLMATNGEVARPAATHLVTAHIAIPKGLPDALQRGAQQHGGLLQTVKQMLSDGLSIPATQRGQ